MCGLYLTLRNHPVGASLLANRADVAQHGEFAAHRGIREQARSYPIQATLVNSYDRKPLLCIVVGWVEQSVAPRSLSFSHHPADDGFRSACALLYYGFVKFSVRH